MHHDKSKSLSVDVDLKFTYSPECTMSKDWPNRGPAKKRTYHLYPFK